MLVLGIMIAAQFRAPGRLRVVAANRDEQAMLLSELVDANSELRAEIESLRAEQASHEGDTRVAGLEELVAELNRLKVLNGMVEVSGSGVELLVDGPLSALDVQDLINELRNAGAEAIALNGRRLVVNSVVVVEDKGQTAVDGQPIGLPYRFLAIGDPRTMGTALLRTGGLLSLFRRTYPNLVIEVAQRSRLVLELHRPQFAFRYAQTVE